MTALLRKKCRYRRDGFDKLGAALVGVEGRLSCFFELSAIAGCPILMPCRISA